MLFFIFMLLNAGEDLFLSKVYPVFSYWFFVTMKYFYLGIVFSLLLKNPGILCRDRTIKLEQNDEREYYICHIRVCLPCNNYLKRFSSYQTSHCYRCDICYSGLDHHCRWIGKCIAKGNMSDFKLYLYLTFGGLFYSLILQMFFN